MKKMTTGKKKAIVLINLGTPDQPDRKSVHRYLTEFLTDSRVIDIPWLQRQMLVRGMIAPFRSGKSAKIYQTIWQKEGSPLLIHTEQVAELLQKEMGDDYLVTFAMRYQNPSIKAVLEEVKKARVEHLIILPLFPQYASATTGSIKELVMQELSSWQVIPKLTLINSFYNHPSFIRAHLKRAEKYQIEKYDHILFSFHGLPLRQLCKANEGKPCGKRPHCCQKMTHRNQSCYSAQCYATARAIAHGLKLKSSQYSICFQSRLGRDEWLKPYTEETIIQLADQGKKRLLVFCPAFVCDCLETLYEIAIEYRAIFLDKGGKDLTLVEGLNNEPQWIQGLKQIVDEETGVFTNANLNQIREKEIIFSL